MTAATTTATLGIVGAGTMGGGIALVAALSGFDVVLHDISAPALSASAGRIAAELRKGAGKGRFSPEHAEQARRRIRTVASFDALSACNVVIEAAIEDLGTKKAIFARLGQTCAQDALLATNTSSFPVTAIASAVERPERALGMHFFNPPPAMKLVEIVRGRRSSDEAVRRAVDLARKLGKEPVEVGDTPGFIVNRCARPFYGEALRILGEGIACAEEIDRICRREGGFRMGPFELMDLIGIDVNFAVTQSLYDQTFGEPRYRPHVIQQSMVDAGLLGRKTRRGFYTYDA